MSLDRVDSYKKVQGLETKTDAPSNMEINWENVVKIIKTENLQKVVELLATHLSTIQQLKGPRGETLLIHAITDGVSDTFTELLVGSKQVDSLIKNLDSRTKEWVHVRDFSSDSPLIHAAAKGRHSIINLLLAQKAMVDMRNLDGKTALMYAKNSNTIQALIKGDADINAADSYGKTVLMYAVAQCDQEGIKILLKKGANVNACDRDQKTALMYAADRGEEAIVKLLIANKANPKAKDKQGNVVRDYVDKMQPAAAQLLKLLPMGASSSAEFKIDPPKNTQHTFYKAEHTHSIAEKTPEEESLLTVRDWKR